jgi:hypothetical protein
LAQLKKKSEAAATTWKATISDATGTPMLLSEYGDLAVGGFGSNQTPGDYEHGAGPQCTDVQRVHAPQDCAIVG